MGKAFLKNTADLLQKKHKRKQWQKIMISLSLVVALLTSCLLIHPAITMSRQATCGQEEHTHTEKCYEKKLICNKEEQSISESSETEGEESVEAHTHSDACYENVLICGKQEHTHSEACYPKEEEKKEEVAANTEEEKSEDKDVKSEDQEDKAEEKTEDTEKAEARTLEVDQADYTVEVDCPAEANIPKDAKLKVREIKKDSDEYQDYYEKAMKAVASGDETDISFARFFDISFEVDGKEIEPEAKVEVKITYDDKVEVPEKGKVKSVHFGNKTEVLDVKTNEKNGKMDEVKFDADSFSVYAMVGTETLTGDVLTADGKTYTVTVTYGADAKIPEGASLKITEFDENSQDYADAKALVVEKKKAEDENFDESAMGLDALDISIVDKDGKEIEPEAEVDVKIERKSLPEDMDAETLQGTMEVQHLDESGDAIAVTTVISSEDTGKITTTGNTVTADFKISSFSKFTITWKSTGSSTKTSTTLQWKKGDTVYTYVSVHYIDTNGNDIPRPSTINDTYTITVDKNFDKSLDINSETLAKSIAGFSFQYAYIQNNNQEQININKVNAKRADKNITVTYYHNSDQKKSVNGYDKKYNAGDIYLVYSGTISNEQHVTVHFVDRDGKDIPGVVDPNENNIEGSTVTFNVGQEIDLSQYKKEGYTYANTRLGGYGDSGVIIYPKIKCSTGGKIQYTTDNTNTDTKYDGTLSNNDVIYVIMDPVPTKIGNGSGNTGSDPISGLGAPATNKTLSDNEDGTYNLSLSITGRSAQKEENSNINVIFVIDNSSSMGSGGGSRLENTKSAVIAAANSLLDNNTTDHPDAVEVALFSFDKDANKNCDWTIDNQTFTTAVKSIQKGSGTNWEDGLKLADDYGTGDGDPTYIIFFTDGMPYGYRGKNNIYEASSNLPAMMAAKDEARHIVNSGKVLYGIFAYGTESDYNYDYLGQLINYAYNSDSAKSTYYKSAAESNDVVNALEEIIASIKQDIAYSDVIITDGITELTSSFIEKSSGTSDYTYSRSGGTYGTGTLWTEAPPASYNSKTGNVTWDLSRIGTLENGVTYTVSFKVWPSQEAYDLVAELKNGKSYGDLTPKQMSQIKVKDDSSLEDPSYTLLTNTKASVEYTETTTIIKNGETSSTSKEGSCTMDNPPGIPLTNALITVQKEWNDSSHENSRPESVSFNIIKDNETTIYKTVELNPQNNWRATIYISPGLKVKKDVLEPGHIYKIRENGESNKYSFSTSTDGIHPMLVDSPTHIEDLDKKELILKGTNTYIPSKFNVKIYKTSSTETNTGLEGAEFKLCSDKKGTQIVKDADGNEIIINTEDYEENGIYSVGDLSEGTYYLFETKAPDGYNKLTDPVAITVLEDKVTYVQAGNSREATKNESTYILTVTNTAGKELPNTGGTGTLPYTLGGLMIMSVAAMMYGFIMRRRGRRLN